MGWDGREEYYCSYGRAGAFFLFLFVMIECMDRLGRFSVGLKIRLACLFGAMDTYIRY